MSVGGSGFCPLTRVWLPDQRYAWKVLLSIQCLFSWHLEVSAALMNIVMFLKAYKVIDHCHMYVQFSSAFYLKTNTTIEKILKNQADITIIGKVVQDMWRLKNEKVLTSAFYATFRNQYLLNGSSNYSDTSIIFASVF